MALSAVQSVHLAGLQLAGGAPFAAMAAVVVLWPLLRQLGVRGGNAELLGLKFQVNSLERKAEEDFALKLDSLRADLEELRLRIGGALRDDAAVPAVDDGAFSSAVEAVSEDDFWAAVGGYRSNRDIHEWRSRTEIDRRLARGVGRLPLYQMTEILDENPNDQEVAMAVAASLSSVEPDESDNDVVELIERLLTSRFERARYRAARAAERRLSRSDKSAAVGDRLRSILRAALENEEGEAVREALEGALNT